MGTKYMDVEELKLEFDKSSESGIATDNLKKMLLRMTETVVTKKNWLFINLRTKKLYVNYTYEYLLDNWKNYNKTNKKSTVFAYYTEVIKRMAIKIHKNPNIVINERRTKLIDKILK
jgi:hypothetical protein